MGGRKKLSKQDKEILDLSKQDNLNLLQNEKGVSSIYPKNKIIGNTPINNLSVDSNELLRLGQLDNDLLLQNNKIGLASLYKSDAAPFISNKITPSEQDLLINYIKNLPQNYEYQSSQTDPKTSQVITVPKYKKYSNPQSVLVPDLLPINPEYENYIDEFPETEKYFSNETDKLIRDRIDIQSRLEQNKNFKNKMIDILNEGEYSSSDIQKILKKLEDKEQSLRDLENDKHHYLNTLTSDFKNIQDDYDYYNKEVTLNKQENLRRVDTYRDELNLLNEGSFQTSKEPFETEEQYLDRLQNNGQTETPESELFNAQQLVRKLFKEKMREIINNPYIIESVSNSLDKTDSVDEKQNILKKWNFFKKTFLDIFGYNPDLSAIEIKDFFTGSDPTHQYFTGKKFETQPKLTINYIPRQKKAIIYKAGAPIIGLYLLEIRGNIELLYSTGLDPSHKKWRPYSSKSQLSSLEDIANATNITSKDFSELFDSKVKLNDKFLIDKLMNNGILPIIYKGGEYEKVIERVPREMSDEESKLRAGYGIKSDEYPEYCQFGSVSLNLKRLHHYNMLVIKSKGNKSIHGFPNVKVSDAFVNIIFNIIHGKDPSFSDLNKLDAEEKELYDILISTSHLRKKFYNTHDKTIESLKRRLQLLESEIEIGNNNPSILEEITKILRQLHHLKVISLSQVQKHIKHIKHF